LFEIEATLVLLTAVAALATRELDLEESRLEI
jgi:hypothetical protein